MTMLEQVLNNQSLELKKAAYDEPRIIIHKLCLKELLNEAEQITSLILDKRKIVET